MNIHATCVALHHKGILITGPSGSGKSDLALRLIDAGAELVADDQVLLARNGEVMEATCPEAGRGLIEVRGAGILKLPFVAAVPLALVLIPGPAERMPEALTTSFEDIHIPTLQLPYLEASTPAKIRLWLQHEHHA